MLRRAVLVVVAILIAAILIVPQGRRTEAAGGELPVGWSKGASLPTSFSPRWDFASAYFPPDDQVVLFGGAPRKVHGDSWRNDTWIYDGNSWTQGPVPPPGLTPRGGAAMAYLPGIGKLVMFGGAGPQWPAYNETWLWNGEKWTKGPDAPNGLKGRTGAQMVYMPTIGKLVLFGGSGKVPYKDTWLFNGTSWTQGPSGPAGLQPRTFFGMAYDPNIAKIVVTGGDGGTDTWYFNGTSWSPGPALAAGERERFRMDYHPDLGGIVMYGGIGPGVSHQDAWLLRGGAWTAILKWTEKPWPDNKRVDGAVLWHPVKDALMLFSGIDAEDGGIDGWRDVWFFREVAPQVQWVHLDPSGPDMTDAITLTRGPLTGGYRNWYYEHHWFKNGALLPNNVDTKLTPDEGDYEPGDDIQAKVRVYDHLGVYGPWVASEVVTIDNRVPKIQRVTMSPSKAYVSSTLTANPYGVEEPDGQSYTLHYQWKVNGQVVSSNDRATLGPDKTDEGDSVTVSVWVTDEMGMSSPTVVSSPKTISWNLNPVVGSPGQARTVKGFGFSPNENVNVKVDSPTGTTNFTIRADSAGAFTKTGWTVPDLPGSNHTLYGVGATSGIVGPGPLTITHLGGLHAGVQT